MSKPDKELVTTIACALIMRAEPGSFALVEKRVPNLIDTAEIFAKEIERRKYPSIRDEVLQSTMEQAKASSAAMRGVDSVLAQAEKAMLGAKDS